MPVHISPRIHMLLLRIGQGVGMCGAVCGVTTLWPCAQQEGRARARQKCSHDGMYVTGIQHTCWAGDPPNRETFRIRRRPTRRMEPFRCNPSPAAHIRTHTAATTKPALCALVSGSLSYEQPSFDKILTGSRVKPRTGIRNDKFFSSATAHY